MLAAGSVSADATVSARFETVTSAPPTLTVRAEAGGTVRVSGAGADAIVGADTTANFTVDSGRAVTLVASKNSGYRFAGWTLPSGLACSSGGGSSQSCVLAAGSVSADATVIARFETVTSAPPTLTVHAEAGGMVSVSGAGADAIVGADTTANFTVDSGRAVLLVASPLGGHRFAGWTLPSGLACSSGGGSSQSCVLAAGSVRADATVIARFETEPLDPIWAGPGSVRVDGATLIAVPYAEGAFSQWLGAPCDGQPALACDISSLMPGADLPTAEFHPFTALGIKSLVFGLDYQQDAPGGFSISIQDAPDASFSTSVPPGEADIISQTPRLTQRLVAVHRLPWGVGSYLTSACDALDVCVALSDGRRRLEQSLSVPVSGYFKAPRFGSQSVNINTGDAFGAAVALSSDGATLAVGAPGEDGPARDPLSPADGQAYRDAVSDNSHFPTDAGAVYVYRRSSTGQWSVDAFIKAPAVDMEDSFGFVLALSSSGAVLAVGARFEDSSHTGTFAPTDGEAYRDAINSDDRTDSGAVTVYRRSDTGGWSVEAFVKAPVDTDFRDYFGAALALSDDGSTLAVGATGEGSASTGALAASDAGHAEAVRDESRQNSGAVHVYRRSDAGGWSVEAFVKAPLADTGDTFGAALALSANGAVLAVGATGEDSSHTGTFYPGFAGYEEALQDDTAIGAGAVTVYRRSDTDRWSVEAFVKAPVAGPGDRFGAALALSANGAVLAVGAPGEDSTSTGTFLPDSADYDNAVQDDSAASTGTGAVYTYSAPRWSVEVFVKAPVASVGDAFGAALALSANGTVLAVGAPGQDSMRGGVFSPNDHPAYSNALSMLLSPEAGAAYLYLQQGNTWETGNLVKASSPVAGDEFGDALALSGDGDTLAVGARREGGRPRQQPASGRDDSAVDEERDSGAVYLY